MQSSALLDRAGRRRSPAALPGYHHGRPPRNKGLRYPPDPPTVEEIIVVMLAGGENVDGLRMRGLIVVLWRAGLRISEALPLTAVASTRLAKLGVKRGAPLIQIHEVDYDPSGQAIMLSDEWHVADAFDLIVNRRTSPQADDD